MFEEIIENTPFTGTLAEVMFRNINGMTYSGDQSFTSTVRALLWNRISNEDKLEIVRARIRVTSTEHDQEVSSRVAGYINDNTLMIANISYNVEDEEASTDERFDAIPTPNGFHEFKDVQVFFKEKMNCRAFVNEAHRCSIVLIKNMTIPKWHLIQCITPKLLPWFFNRSKLSQMEKNVLNSLRMHLSRDYKKAIYAFAELKEFADKKTAAAIIKFKNASLEKRRRALEQSITDYQEKADRMNRDLMSYYTRINECNYTLNGVLAAIKSGDADDNGLSDFISGNKDIHLIDCGEFGLQLILTGYLDVYDPEAFEVLANNKNSYYWDYCGIREGVFSNNENRIKVLRSVFSDDPKFRVRTCGYYELNVENGGVHVSSGFSYGTEYEDYYPNPHLQHHACLGNYQRPINACLAKGDVVGAISQCIASVHSVNVTESPTFRHVCAELFTTDNKLFEDFDGNAYNAKEVLAKLNEGETNNQNTATVSNSNPNEWVEVPVDIPMADNRGFDAAYE